MLSEGISALTEIWTFLAGNEVFKVVFGIAVVAIGIGAFLGLFFRR